MCRVWWRCLTFIVTICASSATLAPDQLQLFNCSRNNSNQQWVFLANATDPSHGAIALASSLAGSALCITANTSSGLAIVADCLYPTPCNQSWTPSSINSSVQYASGCGVGCLNVDANRVSAGADIVVFPCNGEANELFSPLPANNSGGSLVGYQSGLCIDYGSSIGVCASPPFSQLSFCDVSLGAAARIAALVANLTLACVGLHTESTS